MIIGKEALVNIEQMFKRQYRVYPDSADFGIELFGSALDTLRADLKTLKGIYSGTNYSPAPDYNGVKDIIIPLEQDGPGIYRCLVLKVLVSRQFKNMAFIELEAKLLGNCDIPFFTKVAA